ncbi:DNA-binding protein [Nostoc sp. PA-18-2419]|uniref:DNA-binding protein n=1 Tax=Nostoc sp. PA-18-2419 TaxID=2575443 RepID=UPI0011086D91|nr:DNA-binding protein [Nostoc sp. PA-18-2419]
MASITIDISESQLQKLQDLARLHGISLEALLCASIEDWLSSPKSDFTQAANYVLKKNAELYRRLA